ncbi:adenine deaminase [Coraliomargarita parva]|uniref:adenine deaminase n=1 Tax=Coraliomargarita parva TaxID=3014050 RepID=UPI0022B4CDD5|nr:adenine deaminase C-terminal domain-containing protein [Coraliomargarita parva]
MPLKKIAPLHEMTRLLSRVAMQTETPDLVITGARMLSTYSERILPEREIWLKGGRIACVQPAGTARSKNLNTVYYDAKGGIIAPGLVDPHIHIESSMMTACAYAEAALLNGTTTIFCDSHEIGNVAGVDGVEWMLEDARCAPLNIFLTVPSTVPATSPKFETAGGDLTPERIAGIFDKWPEAVALGEKMDFVQVCTSDERSHAIIAEALKRGRPVCGHIYGREFVSAYAAGGVTDTHEAIDKEISEDLLEAGVWIFLRGGPPTTPWHSLPEAIRPMTENSVAAKRVCVCTDDRDADDLFLFGMDWVVRQAAKAGFSPELAWSAGSLHSASRYAMDNEIGGLGPGRRADLVLLNDDLEVQNTWYGGELVVEDKTVTPVLEKTLSEDSYTYPQAAYQTVKLPESPKLLPELPKGPCTLNLLRTELPGIVTLHKTVELESAPESWDSVLQANDLCFLTVVERYGQNGGIGYGLLQNFGLERGAVGSSVGHDAHNIVLAGTNESDMQIALSEIEKTQGAVVVVADGAILAKVDLPIAGLLSDKRARVVAEETIALKKAWNALGCTLPYMGFNLLPLSVIPEIRLTDKGLVTVPGMEILPLVEPRG